MAWTAPRTWVTGEVVTAPIMNTHVRDNFNALSGHAHTGAAGDGSATAVMRLAGSNNTEGTTTSTSAVDIVTVSSLSIATDAVILVTANLRKTSGAAASALVGLKLNTTQVWNNGAWSTGTDQAERGYLVAWVLPRVTNYLRNGFMHIGREGAAGTFQAPNADFPNATVTDVVITGQVGSASITMGVDEVRVYTLPTS
jgi:hypothetical protein